MLIYNHADFHGYQAKNLKAHVTGVAPVAEQGQLFLDSGDTFLKYHNGTTWVFLRDDFLNAGANITELVNNAGYITSYTETDPVFLAHVAAGILSQDIINWDLSFGWGDHSLAGYITTFSETDTLDSVATRNPVTAQNITVGGLVVTGNLTVNGTVTTINTEEINLADNIITLNSNATGAATENAGLIIERGDDINRGFRWNESLNVWEIQKDDSVYYEIAVVDPIGYEYKETISVTSTITHSLDTKDITVQMYDTVTDAVYGAHWARTGLDTILVTFYQIPTNPIRVLITKK